ncbi:MAG: NAD-dependent epimerase/dehydratase family protein [Deltaproteobacteria bacterium]|nr:NAD-dependent epimerase/dehydratase family protein [Deltaproteobacteria bacterium]
MLTLVTGGTGFIGNRLVWELARTGARVRVLVRSASLSTLETSFPAEVEVVCGDILNRPSLQQAMQGCSRVFHLAAYAKNWSHRRELYFEVNLQGLSNVLETARAAGVGRVVWSSSDLTLGPSLHGKTCDESSSRALQACFSAYEESKLAAEKEVARQHPSGLEIVTVLPTRVFGPGLLTEGNSVTRIMELYLRGRFPVLLGGGKPVGNWVLVDDVVRGLIQAAERGRAGERYILGGENSSLREFFQLWAEISGCRRMQFPVSGPVALTFAYLQELRARWFGVYPQITPAWVRCFLCDYIRSSAKAEKELGYHFTSLAEGMRRTYTFLQAR